MAHGLPADVVAKFNVHRADARRRGIEFMFSIQEWWDWWKPNWEQRGRGAGKMVMARHGDVGPYAPWNVRCATYEENCGEVASSVKSDASRRSHVTRLANGSRNPLRERGFGHPKSKAVVTPLGIFGSGNLAAEAEGVSAPTIFGRIRRAEPGYRLL